MSKIITAALTVGQLGIEYFQRGIFARHNHRVVAKLFVFHKKSHCFVIVFCQQVVSKHQYQRVAQRHCASRLMTQPF
jgi:hypothetical protein